MLLFVFVTQCIILFAQDPQYYNYYTKAKEAYDKKDFEGYYTNLKEAYRLHPYQQVIQYRLGIASALTNRNEEAINYLKKAILTDASLKLKDNEDLASLKSKKEFLDLLTLQEKLTKPIQHSDTAFVLKDRTLHTEGIEYNPVQKVFYLGSIHKRKVITVNAKGEAKDFCSSGFEGMTSVFGLKADIEKNILWVCSSPMQEMEHYDSTLLSAVFKLDLKSGKLLKKYTVGQEMKGSVFGDLILTQSGDVIVSDSQKNTLYVVNEESGKLEVFFTSPEFWNIQGMASTLDEKYLFISDYIKGIFRLNTETKELILMENKTESSVKGIDGLYFYGNSLLTVQNGVTPFRASRYYLNKEQNSLVKQEIIDQAHPSFGEPTLGVIVNGSFFYIANSQWGGYENGTQKPASQLKDIVILQSRLR